jgi:hypothetical protein
MEKLFEGLDELLKDPKTSEESKKAIRKILNDEKDRQSQLAARLEKIIRK